MGESTPPNRRRVRAFGQPLTLLLVCALALPQALARSSAPAAPAVEAEVRGAGIGRLGGAASRPAGERLFAAVALRARTRAVARYRRSLLPPLEVRRVIAAGDRIARAPYVYGGGHGSFDSGGYDCSGSVSYALHGGGLLDAPLASGGFMTWGAPGPGRWITIYANGGHAFMVVAGRRFDTTGREQTGSRWQRAMRDTTRYVVRHPPGL